jgi:anti-sigma regulatory factor (Ser/Thr protein kinase)
MWNSFAAMELGDSRSDSAFGRTVPALPDNVADLRHAVVDLAARLGAAEEIRTDVALAVGEACANVVVHAYPPGDVGPLVVHAAQPTGRPELVITVMDQGQGMVPRPDSPGLGLGLPLIANLADHLEIHDGPDGAGTELVMTFSLKRDADRPT